MPEDDQLLTIDEAASRLRIDPETIKRLLNKRWLRRITVAGTQYVPESELRRFLASGTPRSTRRKKD